MDIKDRILEIIKKNNLNASLFADKLGVQRSSLSHILSGRNKPSLDFIQKFIYQFPKEDVSWLITGVATVAEIEKEEIENQFNNATNIVVGNSVTSIKKIERIITFYSDNTCDIYEVNP